MATRFGMTRQTRARSPGAGAALRRVDRDLAAQRFVETHGAALLERLTRTQSAFTRADLVNTVTLGRWPGEADALRPAEAAAIADRLIATEGALVAFPPPAGGTEPVYTTPAMLALEARMLAAADALEARRPEAVPPEIAERVVAAFEERMAKEFRRKEFRVEREEDLSRREVKERAGDLVDHQVAALSRLVEPGEFKLLVGPPGAGKSEMMAALTEAFAAGPRGRAGILATAISDKITANLATDIGQPGVTLPQLIGQLKDGTAAIRPGGMIVLDEAGMVGSRAWAELLEQAEAHRLRLVAVGDPWQIPPAEAGHPLRLFTERYQAAELFEILRQRKEADRAAAMALRAGRAEEALESYRDRGLIRWMTGHGAVLESVANAFAASFMHPDSDHRSQVVLVPDRAEAEEANALVRATLKRNGLLAEGVAVACADGRTREFAPGDRVILNETLEGETLEGEGATLWQGTTGTIRAVDAKGRLTFQADGKNGAELRIDPRATDRPDLDHAYALDLRRAQGIKSWRVFLAVTRPLSAGEALVAYSRHQHSVKTVVDLDVYQDLGAMARDFSRHGHQPMAVELAARAEAAPRRPGPRP